MNSYLTMTIISTMVALLMIVCIIVDIITANWIALGIGIAALVLNTINAIRNWKKYKKSL